MGQRTLVEQAAKGDHSAFTTLIDVSIGRLDTAARLILRDQDLAADAVQDALVRAWRDLPSLRDPDRFDAWLHRLTVNACLDAARRRRRRPIEIELDLVDPPTGVDDTAAIDDRDVLDAALRHLDAQHRAVVVLHFYLGMPMNEVGACLGIPPGTARSRLHYALGTLRAEMVGDQPPARVVSASVGRLA